MKNRPFIALFLALALVCALLVPAAAAGDPSLRYTQSGSSAHLTLKDLGDDSVYGAQLELTLDGVFQSASFAPSASTAYAPPCRCEAGEKTTQVTVYLTDRAPLNKSGSLDLGTLTLPGSFTLPDTAVLTLLDRDLKPLCEGLSIGVSRQSTGGSGSGGGSRPRPTPTPDPEPTPTPQPEPALPFGDVTEKDWFYNEVKYVYDQGMMKGTGDGSFAPATPTSRAMLVTILYRLAGSPAALAPTFPDVAAGQYYAYPVGWAAGQSIVNGYEDGSFRPDGLLTREQLAAILHRYSRAMGYSVAQRGDLTGFTDAAAISPYAAEPMSWAVGAGLLTGMGDGTIAPGGYATRAQVATILARFCKSVAAPPQGL